MKIIAWIVLLLIRTLGCLLVTAVIIGIGLLFYRDWPYSGIGTLIGMSVVVFVVGVAYINDWAKEKTK